MATPHALPTHALDPFRPAPPAGIARRVGRLRAGLLIGATTALTFTVLPGTATAEPATATSAADAAQKVADAGRELEIVTEELNEAKVELERQRAALGTAELAALDAAQQRAALDGRIRQLARSAYTQGGSSLTQLDVLLTSDSADQFVSQLGTLDAIAGHTNAAVSEIADVADRAEEARAAAEDAREKAERSVQDIEVQQKDLQARIADYQRQYDALSAPQQAEVARADGESLPAPAPSAVVAASGAAQVAVDTALAQVGDRYVYGAGGPDAFDCSGLTTYAYAAAGISLPRSSRSQAQTGQIVPVSQLQPGDLLFFYQPTSHVAMYIGNGQMVHASTPSKPVNVASFDSMKGDFTHARRVA